MVFTFHVCGLNENLKIESVSIGKGANRRCGSDRIFILSETGNRKRGDSQEIVWVIGPILDDQSRV